MIRFTFTLVGLFVVIFCVAFTLATLTTGIEIEVTL